MPANTYQALPIRLLCCPTSTSLVGGMVTDGGEGRRGRWCGRAVRCFHVRCYLTTMHVYLFVTLVSLLWFLRREAIFSKDAAYSRAILPIPLYISPSFPATPKRLLFRRAVRGGALPGAYRGRATAWKLGSHGGSSSAWCAAACLRTTAREGV
jgi:hypothetical protein